MKQSFMKSMTSDRNKELVITAENIYIYFVARGCARKSAEVRR